jgi:cytochrome c biogenesis factor
MQNNIGNTIFYSLLFAMGGAPTIAMFIVRLQEVDSVVAYQAFIGLTVIIACILVPLILLQNAYLIFKRKDEQLEDKIKPVMRIYFGLNVLALIFWITVQFILK